MRRAVIGLTGVAVLALVGFAVWEKEQVLAQGRVVLLELAPVDPRSLMQGDYMALRLGLQLEVSAHGGGERDGYVVAGLDGNGVAKFRRLGGDGVLAADEVRLFYRVRGGDVKLGTNAFFFQEGDAELYAGAKYGEARVDGSGQILLTGMRGSGFERLGRPGKERY